jgi:Tol biopolymer transport system component
VTRLGAASFAPYFFPDARRIIFSSNVNDPKRRNFDLYAINTDGTGLERITYEETFDGFPMFTPDGKKLVFASNRNAQMRGDTNIFIADWVD